MIGAPAPPLRHFLVTFEVQIPLQRRHHSADTYQCVLAAATATAQTLLADEDASADAACCPCAVRVSAPSERGDADWSDWPRPLDDHGLIWTIVQTTGIPGALQEAAKDILDPHTRVWEVLLSEDTIVADGSGPEMLRREREAHASTLSAQPASSAGPTL